MEKYSKQIIITIALLFSLSFIGRRYLLGQSTPVDLGDILNENELHTSSLKEKPNLTENNSYHYEDFYHQLQSEGIIITKIQNNNILSQIFPRSKFWQFTNKKGQNLYLADGEDKTEINVINDQAWNQDRQSFYL